MPFDDEPDDDLGRRGPLPPDDRIWRHPSELSQVSPTGRPPSPQASPARGPGRTWGLAIGSALAGAALTFVALAGFGVIGDQLPIRAVEQVAVTVPREPEALEAIVETAYAAVAHLEATSPDGVRSGTAITFRSDGFLITTAELVAGTTSIALTLADGTALGAELVGIDPSNDIAVVQVEASDLPTATLADDSQVSLADRVVALSAGEGWPEGKKADVGVVSGVRQRVADAQGVLHGVVATNVDISGPLPGAALVTTYGAVVGVVTGRGADPSPGGQGGTGANQLDVNHAIPIGWAKHVADEIVAEGKPSHVWVGIEGVDVSSEEMAQPGGVAGARVRRVMDGSPADVADLREGDVVTAVDDQAIASMSDLVVMLRIHDDGDVAHLRFAREGEERQVAVRLTERP